MPVWETLLLDAAGTLVSGATLAFAGWLAHRRGWLAGPLAKLGAWIGSHGGTISADAVKVIQDLIEHEHATVKQAISSVGGPPVTTTGPPIIQGDAGFQGVTEAPATGPAGRLVVDTPPPGSPRG